MTDLPNLDALVIRHIADIEGGMRHAQEVIEPRLWEEAGETVLNRLDKAVWHGRCDPENHQVWIARKDWLRPDKPEKPDLCFELVEESTDDGHGENSWLATFTGSGTDPATTVLSIWVNVLNDVPWRKLLKANPDAVGALVNKGFRYNAKDGTFVIPFVLDRETLAQAFIDEEFEQAFRALAEATDAVVAAGPELDVLVVLARAAAAA